MPRAALPLRCLVLALWALAVPSCAAPGDAGEPAADRPAAAWLPAERTGLDSSTDGTMPPVHRIATWPLRGHLPDDAAVRARLQEFVARPTNGATAVVAGLRDARGVRFLAAGDAGDGAPPDADTWFEAGSITKGLTGLLLAEMIAAGEVRAEQRIDTLFPGYIALAPELAGITLEDLATHHSGLPRLAFGSPYFTRRMTPDPYAGSLATEVFTDSARQRAFDVPRHRGRFAYSNLGYALLGQLLALAAGEDYGSALHRRVLAPLGLGELVLDPEAVVGRAARGTSGRRPVPAWHFDAYAPTGGLQATPRHLLQLGDRLLAADPPWIADALRARRPADDPARRVGLGWQHWRIGGRDLIWHNGGTGGFRSFLAVVPDEDLVLVVLAAGTGDVDGLALALLRVRP